MSGNIRRKRAVLRKPPRRNRRIRRIMTITAIKRPTVVMTQTAGTRGMMEVVLEMGTVMMARVVVATATATVTVTGGTIGPLPGARRRIRRKRRRKRSKKLRKRRRRKPPRMRLLPGITISAGLMMWTAMATMHGAGLLLLERRRKRAKYDLSAVRFAIYLILSRSIPQQRHRRTSRMSASMTEHRSWISILMVPSRLGMA